MSSDSKYYVWVIVFAIIVIGLLVSQSGCMFRPVPDELPLLK